MKSLIITVLLLLGILLLWSCKTQKKEVENTANLTSETNRPLIEGKWHLTRSMDNYNKEWTPQTESETYVSLKADGNYSEKDKWNPVCNGSYRVVAKEKLVVNKECNKVELSYTIKEVTEDKLVLAIQGRHGNVLKEYERVK